jgi:hypothetical protein
LNCDPDGGKWPFDDKWPEGFRVVTGADPIRDSDDPEVRLDTRLRATCALAAANAMSRLTNAGGGNLALAARVREPSTILVSCSGSAPYSRSYLCRWCDVCGLSRNHGAVEVETLLEAVRSFCAAGSIGVGVQCFEGIRG